MRWEWCTGHAFHRRRERLCQLVQAEIHGNTVAFARASGRPESLFWLKNDTDHTPMLFAEDVKQFHPNRTAAVGGDLVGGGAPLIPVDMGHGQRDSFSGAKGRWRRHGMRHTAKSTV